MKTRTYIDFNGIHFGYMPKVAKVWKLTYINPSYTDGKITEHTFSIREYMVDSVYHRGFIADMVGYSLSMEGGHKDFFHVERRGHNATIAFDYGAQKEQFLFTSREDALVFQKRALIGLKENLEAWYTKAMNTLDGKIIESDKLLNE